MKRFALLLIFCVPALSGQEVAKTASPQPLQDMKPRMFQLKHASTAQMCVYLGPPLSARCLQIPELNRVIVLAPEDKWPDIENLLKQLDIPEMVLKHPPAPQPRNVELTVYLIVAGDQQVGSTAIPKELEPALAQIRNTFGPSDLRLLDALAVRTRADRRVDVNSVGGPVQSPAGGTSSRQDQQPIITNLRLESISPASDGMIRLEKMKFTAKVPIPSSGGFQFIDVGLNADVDIKDGQKVVVGRQNIAQYGALFLILSAHVVQ